MKKCTYCGVENPDDAQKCGTCHTALVVPSEPTHPEPSGEFVISPEEQGFWARMTFRQFAILMIKLQAVWMLFYALVDATYLSRYFSFSSTVSSYSALSPGARLDLLMLVLRIIMHVAAAVALIQHAERVLSWLVKDSIPKPNQTMQATAATPRS